jgi:cystathionine beta-synthase
MYNDFWMTDQGFIERQSYGDLRDLIARRHAERADFTVTPDDSLLTAYTRMKLYDISQLPVVENERIVGLIDESDVLVAVHEDEEKFSLPLREAMSSNLQTIPTTTPLAEVLRIFENGYVPLVVDGERYLGLVTRIDVLNFLRRGMRDR